MRLALGMGTHVNNASRFRGASGALALAALLSLGPSQVSGGQRDPEFARFPLDRWLAESRPAQIRWSVTMPPAELSTHQRMLQRVTFRVDGKDLEKRRSDELTGLIEYRDGAGGIWQNHISIDPARMQGAIQNEYFDFSFYAFVTPGDYTIAIGLGDSTTNEHSAGAKKVHVNAPKNDPLPDSWKGLPAVEMIESGVERPDIWFLPDIKTRLNLPVGTKRPVHVQLILNATPLGRAEASAATMRDNMSVLIPAMKILSEIQLRNGVIDASMLDLTRRQVAFGQRNVGTLDWDLLRRYFLVTNPGIIDVQTLAGRMKMMSFFRDEVAKGLAPRGDGGAQVVIVLSGPAFLEDQEPVESARQTPEPGRQLIYIRYRSEIPQRRYPQGARGPARGRRPMPMPQPTGAVMIPAMREDDLQKAAESLNGRVFDAASSEQFRRILAAVLEQVARL